MSVAIFGSVCPGLLCGDALGRGEVLAEEVGLDLLALSVHDLQSAAYRLSDDLGQVFDAQIFRAGVPCFADRLHLTPEWTGRRLGRLN